MEEKARRNRTLKGQVSTTKQKGSPTVGRQSETQFGGPRGNVPGLSREQAIARYEAGKLAERAQVLWLTELVEKMENVKGAALEQLRRDTLLLVMDAIDRANGKAVASLDLTSSDGTSAVPSVIMLVGPDFKEDD